MVDSLGSKTRDTFHTYSAVPNGRREVGALKACGSRPVTADGLDGAS